MSVVIVRPGRRPEQIIAAYPDFGVVAIPVSELRDLGLTVVADPTDDEPDHALVVGDKPKRVSQSIAKMARWVVRPSAAYPPAG